MNYLSEIEISPNGENYYPFNLKIYAQRQNIKFSKPITFIVGENGCGKSTLLEGLAASIGFNTSGGNANHLYNENHNENLDKIMKLTWNLKTKKGFFFRAESFFNFSKYIDRLSDDDKTIYNAYGGKSLQEQSHGESFLSLFANKFREGIFILDEPEAALSPERQLTLISLLYELSQSNKCQFIIATHSPILITTPNSEVLEFNNSKIEKTNYKNTKQYTLYKSFLESPERYIKYLTNK